MSARKPALLLTVLSGLTVLALLATPLAFADDDRDHRSGPSRPQVQQIANQDNDADNAADRDDQPGPNNAAENRLDRLVNAINADVSMLSNLKLPGDNDADADDLKLEDVRAFSLSSLESHLSTTDAATVTNAVNANSGALQTFLNGGSAQASAIDSALNAAGISPSSALVIFPVGGHRLIVVTS